MQFENTAIDGRIIQHASKKKKSGVHIWCIRSSNVSSSACKPVNEH